MKWKPYPEYKDSGVEWLGNIPSEWNLIRLGWLFNLRKRPVRSDHGVVTAFRDGQVTLRANRRTDGYTEADKEIGYQGVNVGDLVIHAMDAFAGAIGVSDSVGKMSPVCSICEPKQDINSRYYGYLMRNIALTGYITSLAKGIRERSTDFRWSDARLIPVTSPENQDQIVKFLDRETAKLDTLTSKQERLINLLQERIIATVSNALVSEESHQIRLSHVCDVISRPVIQNPEESYVRLGLLNRGRGIFKRDETDSDDMGDSDFFWVEKGDLIISGQFAWEGAVALADEEHSGCVVSHRFPVIRGKEGIVLTEYLFALFMTPFGDFILNENSRGSAGRNRPLNLGLLLKEKIPIPPLALQSEVAKLIHLKKQLVDKSKSQISFVQEHRTALISAAVTGKIDVREAA